LRGRNRLLLVLLVALFWGGNSDAQLTREITVSAAISLRNAFEDIGRIFKEKNPGVKVLFNFGSSGDLAKQIEAGAPVDIFASAAQKDMDDLEGKNFIAPNSKKEFARNAVALVSAIHSGIPVQSLEDLQRRDVKKIVIGNPRTVPAGRYAEEALKHFKLWDTVKEKLVFAENVRQALDYVVRNEVDAGLVYATDAMLRSKEVRLIMKVPEESHQPVVYPIGMVKGAKGEASSRKFIDLVMSTEGQAILSRYGFSPVNLPK
jgi:molybdate transport system substrate-binding protein